MAEIKALNSEISRLAASVDWWNSAIIFMAIVAAAAAIGLVVTQYIAFGRAKELAKAESQLNVLHDAQLATDLKEKDIKITAANEKAAAATERTEKAVERAAEANRLAQEEMLARVKIEERLAWRRITPKLHKEMVSALSRFAGSVIMLNSLVSGDPEAETFEDDLEKTMRDAHWDVRREHGNMAIPAQSA